VQLDPGKLFGGDFRVVEPLKHGGMGSVYVVEQLQTGARRALKLMHPQLVQDPKFRRRFEQEARIGAQIPSEHVVQVIAAGVDASSGSAWLVMELLEGEDLDTCLRRRGQLPQAEAMEVLGQLCHALGAAHSVGIVHRDLKPANIFLAVARRRGVPFTVKVLDFGIAKIVAESSTTHTEAVGSPMWMAPEQTTQDHEILPATDVWALGLLTFRLLTGRYYWKAPNKPGATTAMLFREILIEPLPSAAQRAAEHGVAGLPKGFDAWFGRCVAREPHSRYPNAADAFTALEKILSPRQAQGSSPNIDVLGWKEGKEPVKKRREPEESAQRGNQRQAGESSPRKPQKDVLAPVEMPPAREKTPPKHARVSQPPPPPKAAAEKTPPKHVRDHDEEDAPVQRLSRPPPPPARAKEPPPQEEFEPASIEPASVEMTADIYSGPDTVPAQRAALALEKALEKPRENKDAKAKAAEPKADAKRAADARDEAKAKAADAKDTAKAKADAERGSAPPTVPTRTVGPVIDPALLAKPSTSSASSTSGASSTSAAPATSTTSGAKSAATETGAASKPGSTAKPATSDAGAQSKPSSKAKPSVSSAQSGVPGSTASSSLKSPPMTPDTDPRVVETVSGIANTSPDMMLPPRPPPKKLARIGALAAAGGVALLLAVFAIRGYQKGQLEQLCVTNAGDDRNATRIAACDELCKAGSAVHCITYGDLLLHPPPGGTVDKQEVSKAYQAACSLGYDPGCTRVAEIATGVRSTASGTPSAGPSPAGTGAQTDIDIDAEMTPAKHIVVMYQRSLGATPSITRTKEEARARALEALEKVKAGAKFEDVLRDYSDDDLSKARGGAPDPQALSRLLTAIERLKAGDIEIVETSAGFHVVLRTSNPIPGAGDPSGFQPVKKGPDSPTGGGTQPETQPTNTAATGPTTTPSVTPTVTPSVTATTTPTSTGGAGPPDEAAMRRALEPKINAGNGTIEEMRLLKAICQHMGDMQCRNRMTAMIQAKQAAQP
jgi:serine/threonine protein kinase